MKITNKLGLPEALVKACVTERHNKPGCLSATTLLKGEKEILLTERHWDELIDDVSERIWALFGTAVHALLEHEGASEFTEEQLTLKVGDITVTGRIDNYNLETGTITDYKTASVWKVQFEDFQDWYTQGMVYAYLLHKNGLPAKKCRFIALLKDHSKRKAQTDSSYPQIPVHVYEFDVTDFDFKTIGLFVEQKIERYTKLRNKPDDDIPPCLPAERWETPTQYAVMKEGRKSAIRVFPVKDQADFMVNKLGQGHYVQERPGESKKCAGYCICKDFCNFYRNNIKQEEAK